MGAGMMNLKLQQQQQQQQQQPQQRGMNLLGRLKGGFSVEVADKTSGNKLAFTCVFRTAPRGGDLSGIRCLLEAVRHSVNLSIEQERKENLRLGKGTNVTEDDQRKNALVSLYYIVTIFKYHVCM
jgi:hypothetical protein